MINLTIDIIHEIKNVVNLLNFDPSQSKDIEPIQGHLDVSAFKIFYLFAITKIKKITDTGTES